MEIIEVYGLSITKELMMLLMYVPIIVTMVAFFRYMLGTKTFGVYPSLVLALSYYYLDTSDAILTGLKYGLLITLIVTICATLVYKLISKTRMHYLTKISIIYTGVIIGIIISSFFLSYLSPIRTLRLIPLPILMITTISDRLVAYQIKKKILTTIILTAESILVASIGYFLMKWDALAEMLIYNPSILIIILLINLLIGKYSGFRLTEFIRFKEIFKTNLENVDSN